MPALVAGIFSENRRLRRNKSPYFQSYFKSTRVYYNRLYRVLYEEGLA